MKLFLLATAAAAILIAVVALSLLGVVDGALLHSFTADKIDNRPEGRYRFSMLCYQFRRDWYENPSDRVTILGGTSPSNDVTADFHSYVNTTDLWEEDPENRVTFDPRHSMVTEPVTFSGWPDVEMITHGGFMSTPFGTVPVEEPLFRDMSPPDWWYGMDEPEAQVWEAPFDVWSAPGARARSASFTFEGQMYVYGGITGDGVIKGDLWLAQSSATSLSWELMYAPADIGSGTGSSLYTYSAGDWGGGTYTSNFDTGFGSSSYYYGYSSSSYYWSSSSFVGHEAAALDTDDADAVAARDGETLQDIVDEVDAAKKNKKKSNKQQQMRLSNKVEDLKHAVKTLDDLVFDRDQARYEYESKRAGAQAKKIQQQQQQKSPTTAPLRRDLTVKKINNNNDLKEQEEQQPFFPGSPDAQSASYNLMMRQRDAKLASHSSSTAELDKELRRYGACCAAYTATEAVCFGGTGSSGDFRSVLHYTQWEYWWSELNVSNPNDGPKPLRDAACTYSQELGKFIVYGGYDSRTGGATADKSIYYLDISNKSWSNSKKQTQMSPIYGHGMCHAPLENRTYMFGGKSTFLINASLLYLDASAASSHDYEWKQATNPLQLLPPERAHHFAAAVGTSMLVGFGRQATKFHADIWEFDLITNEWSQKKTRSLQARWGCSSAVIGSAAFIFGGRLSIASDSMHTTNELLLFESSKDQLTTVTATNAPSARAFHVSFESGSTVVVGLGQDTNGFWLDDWAAFSPITQQWEALTLTGDAISARIGASAVQSFNESHSIVGLGYNGVSLNDLYFVQKKGSKLVSTKIGVGSSYFQPRVTRRSFASVAGRGRHILVCGGMVSSELAAPPGEARCYQVDVNGEANTIDIGSPTNLTSPVGLVGAPAVYMQDSVFTFGGQVISDPTVSDVFLKRVIRSRANSTCLSGGQSTDDTDCALCGFGSSGSPSSGCQWTAPGYYTTVDGKTIPCPKGTFSHIRGASSSSACSPCRVGTKNGQIGQSSCTACNATQFCPIGSSAASASQGDLAAYLQEKIPADGVLLEDNPAALGSITLPWMVMGLVGGTAFTLAGLVALALYLNNRSNKKKLDYYLPEDVQLKLDKIFVSYAEGGRELKLPTLIKVYNALGMGIPATVLEKTFEDITEDSGDIYINMHEFKKSFVDLIRAGILPPFKGSEAETHGREMPEGCCTHVGVDMSKFDSFRAEHITGKLGEPSRVRQTNYGGVLTVLLFLTQVVLLLAILVNFLYANTTETKAIVPYPVVQAAFGDSLGEVESDFTVEVSVSGPIRESLRFKPSDTVMDRALKTCVDVESADPTACINETRVTPTGMTIPQKSNEQKKCRFENATRSCVVTWTCTNCTVVTTAQLLFQFSQAQSANRINVRAVTSTGIRMPKQMPTGELEIAGGPILSSTLVEGVTPRVNSTVFSGFPATEFSFGLSPTYFESVELVHVIVPAANPVLENGYHLRPDNDPQRGNAIEPEFFGAFYDCPVKVNFKTDSEMMYVRRQFLQTLVDLVVSILSAVTGVVGIYLTATNFLDEWHESEMDIFDVDEVLKKRKEAEEADEKATEELKVVMKLPFTDDGAANDGLHANHMHNVNEGDETGSTDGDNDDGVKPKKNKTKVVGSNDIDTDALLKTVEMKVENSMTASDADCRRVLPLVTLGMGIDLALKFQNIIEERPENIPPKGPDFSLDEALAETGKKPSIGLDDVEQVEFMVPKKEEEGREGRSNSEPTQAHAGDGNAAKYVDNKADGDDHELQQIQVESAKASDEPVVVEGV